MGHLQSSRCWRAHTDRDVRPGLWIAVEGGPFAGVDINIFEFEVANPSNIRQVSFETANTGQPAYKTNGSRVGGVSRRLNNHLDLYEWDRTSLGHARVTFDAEEIADAGSVFPAYSPDGTKVAFASKRVTGDYNIWVLDISEQPIPVDLLSFQVSSTDDGVLVSWRSAGDASDVAGYHVHKGPEVGHLERLTTSILSGGPEYRFLHPAATMPGTKYWLEEISRSGSRAWYGPRELKEFVLPVVHALRAFPNPFHGSVEILYNSPASQDIQVALFDMSGRQVSRLFDGTVSGELRLAWNGRSDSGEALPAGVYFARVTGDVSTTTLKVLKLE